MFLGRRNILRNIVSRNNWASTICTIPFRGFAFKSSEMICARNYNIFTKEKSDTVETDQFGYFAKVVHSIFISGGWVLNGDINYNKFKLAIEESLNVLPHFGGRISGLTDEKITFYYNNQGIKFDVVCHPEFSLNPTNIEKYNNLQNALKPYNRNIFFTDDKPLVFHDEKEYEQVPIMIIQLNYLNKENMDDDGDGCIVTFKMSHGFGDGYTGYYYMKCLSDCLCGKDLNEYNKSRYEQIMNLDIVDKNMSSDDFEKKWGFNDNENGKEVLPNFTLYKHNPDEVTLVKSVMDGFADSLAHEMEYFTLKFTQKDIDEINKTKDDQLNIYSLTYHLSHNQTQNHIQNKNKSQHPNNKNLIKKHNKTLGNDETTETQYIPPSERNFNDETTQTQYIPPSRSQISHFKSNVLKDLNDKIQENIKYNKIINDKIITNTPTTILPNTPDNINNIDNMNQLSNINIPQYISLPLPPPHQ
eukprot:237571_1